MAKKKLDNLNDESNELEDAVLSDYNDSKEETSAYDLDGEEDTILDDDDDDFHFEFESEDDEENDESDLEEEDESDEQDEEEPDEDEPEQPTPKKRTSKEEKAIVALKRERQKLREENRKMQEMLKKRQESKQSEGILKKYLSEGYDEDTAKRMTEQDLVTSRQQERLELLEFKDENSDVLRQFPRALREADRIKRIVDTAGITVEQACRGLYGTNKRPDYEERARSRVAAEDDYDNDPVSRASRSSRQPQRSALTAQQKRMKSVVERRFLDGEKMSDKEFLDRYNRYTKG